MLPEVKIEETKTRTFPEWFNDEIMLNPDNIRVKNYRKAETRNPDFSQNWDMFSNIYDFTNIATAGAINRFSPTQNIRLTLDAVRGNNVVDSWMGNNGIVTDRFAKKHPYWSMAINGVGDGLMTGVRAKNFDPKVQYRVPDLNNRNIWHDWGSESLVQLGNIKVSKIPKKGSFTKLGLGFDVRKKLEANNVPGHVPYEYQGYTKIGSKYYPIYRQDKVSSENKDGMEELLDIERTLKKNKYNTSINNGSLEAQNKYWNIHDIYNDHNIGNLNGNGVMYDAILEQGMFYPYFWAKNNLTMNPNLISVGTGIVSSQQ